MQISQTQDEIQALVALHTRCALGSVTLLSCAARRIPFGSSPTEPIDLRAAPPAVESARMGQNLRVHIRFSQTAMDASAPQQEIFAIDCVFEACYQLEAGYQPSDEEIKAFSEGNAVFNVWPYARQFLQDMSTRMSFNPPPLPLLRFAPPPIDREMEALPPTSET